MATKMRHLTFLLLLFSTGLSGQINDDGFYTTNDFVKLNIDSAFLWAYDPDYKIPVQKQRVTIGGGEGIEVISSMYDTQNITFASVPIIESISSIKDTIKVEILVSIDGALKVVNGYDVRRHMGTSFIRYDGYGNQFEDIRYEHEVYLDEHKKPLNKNYIIWQIKSEN